MGSARRWQARFTTPFSPVAIWYMGGAWNLLAAVIFASLAPAYRRRKLAESQVEPAKIP